MKKTTGRTLLKLEQKKKILFLMIISMILSYLPWYNFSAVLGDISRDFQLTSSQTGLILASFQIGYVILVLLTGYLADRVGTKKVLTFATLAIAISSTSFVFFAHGFTSILILRLLTGIAAGGIFVPGMALLSSWFPPKERGRALGSYTAALTIAYAGAYFIASPLAATYGWKVGILSTSLPAFLAALILFLWIQEAPKIPSWLGIEEKEKEIIPNKDVKPAPEGGYLGPLFITTGYMGHTWELYAFWGWVGPFMVAAALKAGYPGSEAQALGGQLAAFIILLGAPAVILLGMAADRFGRTRTILFCSLCSLSFHFFFGYLYGQNLLVIVLAGLWIGFWVIADSAIYKAGLTEMISDQIRSTTLGIQSAAGYTMTIISPIVFGNILGRINSSPDPTMATNWGLPFLILGAGALLTPLSMILLRSKAQSRLMADGKG